MNDLGLTGSLVVPVSFKCHEQRADDRGLRNNRFGLTSEFRNG
jgi:hypothetical protein